MEKYLYYDLAKLTLLTELDIVLAYQRARQLCEVTGITEVSQTKFSTAVAEISRNVLEHVGEGAITFHLVESDGKRMLEALVSDKGRGISNVEDLLARKVAPTIGKGSGIFNSRKLVDNFHIDTHPNKGTKVYLRKSLPLRQPPINAAIVEGWKQHFASEATVVSPYGELKRQNTEMLEVLEALRVKNIQTEHQLEQIKSLHLEVSGLLAEREERNQVLQKMNQELEDFSYTVSHDLKAPLRNMEGLSNLLEKALQSWGDESTLLKFGLLKSQITRMDKLISGILSYAKSGIGQVERNRVDTGLLLQEVISSLTIPEGFTVEVQEAMPVMVTEEIYLQQIFTNLISNALKYHDQPSGKIQVGWQLDGDLVQFTVSDDGPGILPQYHEKIFKIFYSIHRSTSQDSSGLGLAIIKRITEERGGKVWVHSEGRGSQFCFSWPR